MCTSMSHPFLVSFYFYILHFQDFEAHVRVTNVRSGEVYVVRERVENKRVTLKMYRYTEEKPHLCIYSRSSGFGHTVYGKLSLLDSTRQQIILQLLTIAFFEFLGNYDYTKFRIFEC